MKSKKPEILPFEHRMSKREFYLALMYLPIHIFILPTLISPLILNGRISEADANFIVYAIGTGFVFATCWGFLRRDFDPLWDRPFFVLMEIMGSYGLMFIFNMAVNLILVTVIATPENPNNMAIGNLLGNDYNKIATSTVIFAPIVEEITFRGALFGSLMKKKRALAYVVSVLVFSLYHVWAYMLVDWKLIIYIIQYIPVSFLLCRVYERTGTIWGSIFFHMMVNGVSVNMLNSLGSMMG